MIDYLTHPKFVNYDPSILPSSQGGGGGMGTKTSRVLGGAAETFIRERRGFAMRSEITAETVSDRAAAIYAANGRL